MSYSYVCFIFICDADPTSRELRLQTAVLLLINKWLDCVLSLKHFKHTSGFLLKRFKNDLLVKRDIAWPSTNDQHASVKYKKIM